MAKKEVDEDLKAKCRIVTPEFRVSYPHVFKPAQVKGKGEFKYSVTMLFPKDGDLSLIKKAIRAAKVVEFGEDKSEWPSLNSPVEDGDLPKHANKEGYKGHWVVKAISNEASKPGLIDGDGNDIMNERDFYPGCFARAQVFARVWEFSGKQGVHFIVDHVQKLREGKSLSSRKSAQEAFGITAGRKRADEDDDDDSETDF